MFDTKIARNKMLRIILRPSKSMHVLFVEIQRLHRHRLLTEIQLGFSLRLQHCGCGISCVFILFLSFEILKQIVILINYLPICFNFISHCVFLFRTDCQFLYGSEQRAIYHLSTYDTYILLRISERNYLAEFGNAMTFYRC